MGRTVEEQLEINYVGPKGEAWKETTLELPPYPDIPSMQGGELQLSRGDLTYKLDLDSIAIGEDGVTRYTIVITSSTGAQNILYEGVRCQTAEYKSYAFGSQGGWSEAVFPQWQSVGSVRGSAHRRELFLYYFCDEYRSPLPREQVLARIKDPYQMQGGRP